jgi:hypothetical protein
MTDELTDELEQEIARLRDRAALLESLLAESIRHGYPNPEHPTQSSEMLWTIK